MEFCHNVPLLPASSIVEICIKPVTVSMWIDGSVPFLSLTCPKKGNFVLNSPQIEVYGIIDRGGLNHSSEASVLGSPPLELGSIFSAATLDRSFHVGHNCHSPHCHGPWLSICPYQGKSDTALSLPSSIHASLREEFLITVKAGVNKVLQSFHQNTSHYL